MRQTGVKQRTAVFGFCYKQNKKHISCFTLVGKSTDQICGLRGSHQLHCEYIREKRLKEMDTSVNQQSSLDADLVWIKMMVAGIRNRKIKGCFRNKINRIQFCFVFYERMRSKCGSSNKDEVNFNSPQLTKMSLSSFYLQSQRKMPIVSLFKFDKNKIYMIIKVAFLVMKMNIIPFVILL